jgi:hypothetical protein
MLRARVNKVELDKSLKEYKNTPVGSDEILNKARAITNLSKSRDSAKSSIKGILGGAYKKPKPNLPADVRRATSPVVPNRPLATTGGKGEIVPRKKSVLKNKNNAPQRGLNTIVKDRRALELAGLAGLVGTGVAADYAWGD